MSPSHAFSLHEAASYLASHPDQIADFEFRLAQAIEHGELSANIKRWATEQWEGQQLPGNINRLETWIEPAALANWQAAHPSS